MHYLDRLEAAILAQAMVPAPTPAPPREIAAALDTLPEWRESFAARERIIAAVRELPHIDASAQAAELSRTYTARVVDAALTGKPFPEPFAAEVARVRAEAEENRLNRDALRAAAAGLLPRLADIVRASSEHVMRHLHGRLAEIIDQARELGVSPADIPTGNGALRLGEEERAALVTLEELGADYAEVRRAQADALGVRQLDAARCFANAEELHPWGADAPWPGELTNPTPAHLAWVATTPGVEAWVPTAEEYASATDRLKRSHARAEYDHLRRQRDTHGSLTDAQRQQLERLGRVVNDTPAADIGPTGDPDRRAARRPSRVRRPARA